MSEIILNGEKYAITLPLTVQDLLTKLELADKPVVVELNGQVAFVRDYINTQVLANSQVEIVTLAVGG